MPRHLNIIRKDSDLSEKEKEYLLSCSSRLAKILGDELDWQGFISLATILEIWTILWNDGFIINSDKEEEFLDKYEAASIAYTLYKGDKILKSMEEAKWAILNNAQYYGEQETYFLGKIVRNSRVSLVGTDPYKIKKT